MPILICQEKKNKNRIVTAVEILVPILWTNKKTGQTLELQKGQYLIKSGNDAYPLSEKEFEDTYLIRKIVG